MRYRLIATYFGAPYQAAFGPGGDEVTLFAACPPPEELGFSSAAGHWRLDVTIAELDGLRLSRPAGLYRGARCLVLDDQGDRLHIAYLGQDASEARQLGYWEIDREVFEMVVPRTDITELAEEQVDIPAAAAMIPGPPAPVPPPAAMAQPTLLSAPPATGPIPMGPIPMGPGPMGPGPMGPGPMGPGPMGPGPAGPTSTGPIPVTATRPQPVIPPETPMGPLADAPDYSNEYHGTDRVAAWHGSPEPWGPAETSANGGAPHHNGNTLNGSGQSAPRTRTARRDRIPIQSVFAELLDLAAIPQSSYAVDDEVPGAMCLLKVEGGFEVFASSEEARLEVRFFEDEESAYFYLFGVLAADAVRNGDLGPTGQDPALPRYAEHL